jgi:cytosine/adenosine deaminase-related metal-dependent hydrolase
MAILSRLFRYVFTGVNDAFSPRFWEWVDVTWDESSGRLLKCHPLKELPFEGDAVQEASRLAMTPAFVNAHTHLDLWSESPVEVRDGESMVHWLQRVNASRASDTAEDVLNRVRISIQGLRQNGTGTVADITQSPETLIEIAQACLQGSVALEYFHPAPWQEESSPLRMLAFYERWQRIQRFRQEMNLPATLDVGISPHSPYNVSLNAWQAIHNALKPKVIHSHLAEFQGELDYFTGKDRQAIDDLHRSTVNQSFIPQDTFLDYLQPQVWTPQDTLPTPLAIIAHGSLLTPKQVQAFYKGHPHSVLVTCPRSNLFLHACTLYTDVPFETEIPVILGTDSAMSCPSLDIRDEVKAYQDHHGIELTPFEALALLTSKASKALGLGADLGKLERGYFNHAAIWEISPETTENAASVLASILDAQKSPQVHQLILQGRVQSL